MTQGKPLRILHVAETTHGGIRAYWHEIKAAPDLTQNFLAPLEGTRGLKRCWWLFKALRHQLRTAQYDILFLHSTFAGVIGRLAVLTLWQRPKVIYCSHGWAFNMAIPNWKKRLYGVIERLLLPLTDAAVHVSQFEADSAICYGIKGDKCHVILNGIHDIAPNSTHTPAPALKPTDKIHLLFVGRFHPAKGADLLQAITQQALVDAPQTHFHVVGGAQADNESELTFPANTTCYGWLPREDILPLYKSCDALIVPSRWDAFSLVAAEALRASKALIVNDAAALPEFITNGAQGYVIDMTDTHTTTKQLQQLTQAQLRKMGAHNRTIYQQTYTAERMNRELNALYRLISDTV